MTSVVLYKPHPPPLPPRGHLGGRGKLNGGERAPTLDNVRLILGFSMDGVDFINEIDISPQTPTPSPLEVACFGWREGWLGGKTSPLL